MTFYRTLNKTDTGHFVLTRPQSVHALTIPRFVRFKQYKSNERIIGPAHWAVRVSSTNVVEQWCSALGSPGVLLVEETPGDYGKEFTAIQDAPKGSTLISLPGDVAVTLADVEQDEELGKIAKDRSELVSLALFVAKHKALKEKSPWKILMNNLPNYVDSPIFWSEEDRIALLKGSPVLKESRQRSMALHSEWEGVREFCPTWLTEEMFRNSMSVVLSHAVYLPSVSCFALLPILGDIPKTGSESGAVIDYDPETNMVILKSSVSVSTGDSISVFDGRPNGELFMATGAVERANPSDYLLLNASLVAADRLYTMKEEVANAMGMSTSMDFPIYEDRLATQHLAYLRMSRLTDAAQMAKVSFEEDVIISQENEYEILQLIMGDLREWLQNYETGMEEDVKELQRNDLTPRERMAAMLRFGEKRILRGTMDGVRMRLAPIRGIPTKSGGLQDPNADLIEIFEAIESIPSAPQKMLRGFQSWFRGDQDPDWKR